MNRKKNINLVFGTLASLILLLSFSTNPPNGNTGAPGDGLCSGCHSGSAGNGSGLDGTISLTGLPANADGGTVYSLDFEIEATMGAPNRAGFQVVALKDATNTNAGDMSNAGTGSSVVIHNSRDYLEHQPAQLFGGGSTVNYTVDWEAPTGNDDITFYAIALLGNGSGTGDDKQILAQFTTSVMGADPLDVTITASSDVSCFGESDGTATAEASGGVPPYDYEWENGETGPMANSLDAGIHTVTVTDDTGTEATADVLITEPDEINVTVDAINISCFGETDGSATANPSGGTGGLDCEWSTGDNTCTIDNLVQGTYFVTITDDNGCTTIGEVSIDEPEMISVNTSSTDESSPGAMDGTATAEASGGTSPYIFDWSTGETEFGDESTIMNLSEGIYTVTVIDNNDCEVVVNINVAGGGCALEAEAFAVDVSCFGENDGMIDLTVTNGAAPIAYTWSNGATTQNIDNLGPGTYSVTIVDNGGCDFVVSNINISEPPALLVNTLYTIDPVCPTDPTGEIAIAISGGAGDYTLSWSTGITNDTTIVIIDTLNNITEIIVNIPDTLSGILPGEYIYTVVDGDGCTVSDTIELISNDMEPPILVLQEGFLYLDSSGNGEPFDFSMVDGGSSDNCGIVEVVFDDPGNFDCSSLGAYSIAITIIDAAGNMTSEDAVFNVTDTIPPVLDCSMLEDIVSSSCDPIEFGLPDAMDNCMVVDLSVVGGFDSGSVFPSGETVVTYRATDDCGNFSECSFTVTINIDLMVMVESTAVSCNGGSDGSMTIVASGGTAPYEIIVNPPVDDLTNLPAGTYSVTIRDAGNCLASETVEIMEPDPIELADVIVVGSGWDAPEGSIELDIIGGTGPYSIDWYDSEGNLISSGSDSILTGLGIGSYSVIITDDNGCTSESFSIFVDSTSATIDPGYDNLSVSVAPNPSTDRIIISHKEAISNKIEIIGIDGQRYLELKQVEQDQSINISDLSSGLYLIKLYQADKVTVKQFMKI